MVKIRIHINVDKINPKFIGRILLKIKVAIQQGTTTIWPMGASIVLFTI